MKNKALIKLIIFILVLAFLIPLLKPKIVLFFSLLSFAYEEVSQYEATKEDIYNIIKKGASHREAFFTRDRIYENLEEIEKDISNLGKAKEFISRAGLVSNYILRLKAKQLIPKKRKTLHNDTIVYLTNGRQIEGRFKKEKDGKVFLDMIVGSSFGTIGIGREDIKSVKRLK